MAFRKDNGEYLGSEINYEYTNSNSLNKHKKKKARSKFVTLILTIIFLITSVFLFYATFSENISDTDENNYLFYSVVFLICALYMIYRLIKSTKEEKVYAKELEKLKNDQES